MWKGVGRTEERLSSPSEQHTTTTTTTTTEYKHLNKFVLGMFSTSSRSITFYNSFNLRQYGSSPTSRVVKYLLTGQGRLDRSEPEAPNTEMPPYGAPVRLHNVENVT
ncbi:hypothetical protein E2C01_039468 [Portunus trituberculatus]|uniref:Uncharacterized protein n=1 Tax=Portunus trituberculatus TaxID=210409 RepID=A0A5B7FGX5_PORTR|nr:hypothetical protein [Portunus trituberculatus]